MGLSRKAFKNIAKAIQQDKELKGYGVKFLRYENSGSSHKNLVYTHTEALNKERRVQVSISPRATEKTMRSIVVQHIRNKMRVELEVVQ